MVENTPQETAAVLGFETSDADLRKFVELSARIGSHQSTMSESIIKILKEHDIPVNEDTKKAAGASFLFTFGMARAIAKAEVLEEMGV